MLVRIFLFTLPFKSIRKNKNIIYKQLLYLIKKMKMYFILIKYLHYVKLCVIM